MSRFTQEELNKKKVAELKEIAQAENVDVKNLRKAEIISALLEHFSSQIEEQEILENADEIADNNEEVEDTTEIDEVVEEEIQPVDIVETDVEETTEYVLVKNTDKPQIIRSYKPKMIYKDFELSEYECSAAGLFKVLEDFEDRCKVRVLVSGRGFVFGYMKK